MRPLMTIEDCQRIDSYNVSNSSGIQMTFLECEQMVIYADELIRQSSTEQYTRELTSYYLGIASLILGCLGLIGNMISLIVLTHKTMRSSTYSYLSALSVCDSLFLLFTIVILVKDLKVPVYGEQKWPWDEGLYPYLFPYVHAAAFTFQVTSIWLTLAFTVDRYIMICHPFRAEPLCSVTRARKVVVSLYILSILFNIPKFFEYKTVAITLPNNVTKIGCDLTDFGKMQIFRELYHQWLYMTLVCGLPFVGLAVLNAFLMHAVRLSRLKGREINANERKRNDTTMMLISVVVVFFICQMPALVNRFLWAFEEDTEAHKKLTLYTINEVGNFLIGLNSAINIVPYYFFGKRFRKQFWRLFCQCVLKNTNFSRTFSQTMFDATKRTSNGSAYAVHNVNKDSIAEPDIRLARLSATSMPNPEDSRLSIKGQPESSHLLPPPPYPGDHGDATGSLGSDKDSTVVKAEVNGNCSVGDDLTKAALLQNNSGSSPQHSED